MGALSIGIVGCGAIGRALLTAADTGKLPVAVAGVTSRSEKPAREFLATLRRPPPYLDLPQLIAQSDLVIEAAGGRAVVDLAAQVFAA
jgi:predicted dinucleotide-utilizing enzyme